MTLIISLARLGFSNGLITLWLFLLLLLVAALCVHHTFYRRSKRFMDLANRIPGPTKYPFIGSAYVFGTNAKDILQNVTNLCVKYDKIFQCWIGPELYICLQDAKDVEVILTNNRLINKPSAYQFMKLGIGDGILASSGEKWKRHRKVLKPTFGYTVYQSYIEVFNEKMRLLMEVLEQQVDKEYFNISHFFHNAVLDILWETILTTKSNTLMSKKGTPDRFSEAVNSTVSIILCRMFKPWLFVDSIFNKTANGREAQSHMKYVHDKINEAIYGKRRNEEHDKIKSEDASNKTEKQKIAFLEYTLEHASENKLTDEDILSETCTIVFAGFDSTASTLAFMCCILSRRFDVQEKLVQEIKDVYGSLEHRPFTYFDFQQLEYMDRVMKECQRLLTTIPFVARQLTEDIELPSGYTLPEGSAVFLPFYRLHRDPTYYPNPDVFDPDNFLPDRVAARPTYTYCPFSAGARDCIGKKYAMLQLQGGLLNILRRFWITPADCKLELAAKMNLHPVNGIHVGLKKRTEERPVIAGMEEMSKYLLTNLDYLNVRFKDSYL